MEEKKASITLNTTIILGAINSLQLVLIHIKVKCRENKTALLPTENALVIVVKKLNTSKSVGGVFPSTMLGNSVKLDFLFVCIHIVKSQHSSYGRE